MKTINDITITFPRELGEVFTAEVDMSGITQDAIGWSSDELEARVTQMCEQKGISVVRAEAGSDNIGPTFVTIQRAIEDPKPSPRAIFDNGGGVTLQLGDYAHHYADPKQAAGDWASFQSSRNTKGWEGHEEESAALEPTEREIRNGGYRIRTEEDIDDMISDPESTGWNNMDVFITALLKTKSQ